jgi:hypothetical protein
VEHVKQTPACLDDLGQRQGFRPCALVDVAANGKRGRDVAKRIENLRPADVAGMENEITAAEGSDRLGTNQTVGIRDDADRDPVSALCQLSASPYCERPPRDWRPDAPDDRRRAGH